MRGASGQYRGLVNRLDLLILDDLIYVTKDQAEANELFELMRANCETDSGTAEQPFGELNRVALAAMYRFDCHATMIKMTVESYRRRTVSSKKLDLRQFLGSDDGRQSTTAIVLARLPDQSTKRIHELLPWNRLPQSVSHVA